MAAIFRPSRIGSAARFVPQRGVLGSAVPSTGANGPALAYPHLDLPGDASKVISVVVTAAPPGFTLYEDTSYDLTLTADGTYSITFQLYADGMLQFTDTATVQVGAGASTPIAFSGPVPAQSAIVGTAFNLALAAFFSGSATPFSYLVLSGQLPAGLSLNAATGVISGTPTTAGSAAVVVRAMDANSVTTSAPVSFTVSAAAPAPDTTAPAWPGGAAINATTTQTSITFSAPAASDDRAVTAYRWRVNGGAWTQGITPGGTINGLAAGTAYTLELQAADSVPNWSASLSAVITTAAATPTPGPSDDVWQAIASLQAQLDALYDAGLIRWDGQRQRVLRGPLQ